MPATNSQESPAKPTEQAKRSFPVRLRGVLVGLICWSAIALAWSLEPRFSGYGTHQQLGLPGCSFLARNHLPCPSCGMTTSTVAMVHGRVSQAWSAQPFGVVFFAFIAIMATVGTAEFVSGKDIMPKLKPSIWWLAIGIAGMLAGWGWNLAVGYYSGQLPIK